MHNGPVTVRGLFGRVAFILGTALCGCVSPTDPSWVEAFGYSAIDLHPLKVGDFGYLYVDVRIGDARLWLPFDTGNMIGLSVSSEQFDDLGLTADGFYDRVNSAGETVATLRMAKASDVSFLGRELGPTQVYELEHPRLPGLAGPTLLEAGHFTLDYRSRRMGIGTGKLPDSVPGFLQVPLVRSSRHPMLILVRGTIEGVEVLLELDTGKSRTVVNPDLSSELTLERKPQGVLIRALRIGDLSFEVPSAKEVDQTGIDPSLPEPIRGGIGSDILSRFVWAVDYEADVLWIPASF